MHRLLRLRVLLPGAVALISLVIVLSPNSYIGDTLAAAATYLQTFDGTPSRPTFWQPVDWDVTIFGHNAEDIEPMQADHGPDCSGPPNTHLITRIEETVYICNDHVMTAMNNGYGAVYLTPNQLLDFSAGPATLRWDMSTARKSSRDWVDIVVMPYNLNQQVNFIDFHRPQDAVHLSLAGGNGVFLADIFRNYTEERVSSDWYHNWDMAFAARGLTASQTRRDTFELTLSRTHIKVSMPAYNLVWVDADIAPLNWSQGVVQLNQRTYNPNKACDFDGTCGPNTWHWDNVSVSPAAPFTILRASRRFVDETTSPEVTFPAPAPANANLRFSGTGKPIQYSVDGGRTWLAARVQGDEAPDTNPEIGDAFWSPVPQGTRSVMIRGTRHGTTPFVAQDISIWAPGPQVILPTQTPVVGGPTALATATGTPTPRAGSPTNTPTPSTNRTATPTPRAPTVTPTATPRSNGGGANSAATATPTATRAPTQPPGGYLQTFDGAPSAPQNWRPANWDVTARGKDSTNILPMDAAYGANCGPPPATHRISLIEQTAYICDNHLMTAINSAGGGGVYLTPDRMLDFSKGEAVLKWDMSTARTSSRDWVDVVIQPFEQNTQINFEGVHVPREAIHLEMAGGTGAFVPTIVRNFVEQRVSADTFNNWDKIFARFGLIASATRRDTFELRVSRTHIKFMLPGYNTTWIDSDIAPLSWNQGVVQFVHRSFDPSKGCSGGGACGPNTWHWDNVSLAPAMPFSMLRGDQRYVDSTTPAQVNFPSAAPAGARLRFIGQGKPIQFSVNGGATWTTAVVQGREAPASDPAMGDPFWTPVPQGTRSVLIRGTSQGTVPWLVQDISIWAPATN